MCVKVSDTKKPGKVKLFPKKLIHELIVAPSMVQSD